MLGGFLLGLQKRTERIPENMDTKKKTMLRPLTLLFCSLLLLVILSNYGAAAAQAPPPQPPPLPAEFGAQAAAMLPAFVDDVAQPEMWDRYSISAVLQPETQRLHGQMRLLVTNRSADQIERLYFWLYPNHRDFGGRLDVTAARVAGVPVASGTEQGDTLFWLALPRPLAPGVTTIVELSFTARTPRNASSRTFGAFNQEAGLWSLANFYPVLARYFLDSGWDRRILSSRGDFAVTATALYDVTIDVPASWQLVTTGVQVANAPVAEGWRRERFVSGPQREFYLGATQGIEQVSSRVDGVRVVSHYQPGNAAAGRRALQWAEESLRQFNQRFGPYPLAEVEVVQGAMTTFLGMEYPGVVLIEQDLYWSSGRGLETTVVHEVAHQWWYSLVGNDAQGEAWIDEGLASYAQVLYYEALGQPELVRAELDAFRALYRQARDRGNDRPLATPP
ncbi:MAG: M1 family peptidase, partial [Candidatus Viridilinea halotolerans]